MILPENGSIVVIDDDPKQAMPIIKAFARKGISTIYYRGINENELPESPVSSIRLAIVDLQLLPTDRDAHNISTRLLNVLQRIISPLNGPYMLLIWSLKDHLFGEEFRNEIRRLNHEMTPICIATIDKSACIEQIHNDDDEMIDNVLVDIKSRFDTNDLKVIRGSIIKNSRSDFEYEAKPDAIRIIEENLKAELKKAGVFHLFVIWENLIRKAGIQAVNTITSTIDFTDLWENNMRDVLKRMGQARTGKNILVDDLFLKAALTTFSGSFSEELDHEIRKLVFPDFIRLDSPFSIAGKLDQDIFKIIIYSEGEGLKARLQKNEQIYKGKDNISFAKILNLSNGLDKSEKPFVDNLIQQYLEIPFRINSKLHIEFDSSGGHMPGNVYKIDLENEEKKGFLYTYFDKVPGDANDFHFIELEISPLCDYAQKKWKKSRLLSGLVYPSTEKLKQGDFFYSNGPVIMIENRNYRIAFCYLLFKAKDIEEIEQRGNVWFRIKRELFQDIVSGLSGHVNRPGIITIN